MTDNLLGDFSSGGVSPSVIDLSVADDDDTVDQLGGSDYNSEHDAIELEKFNKLVEQVDQSTNKPSPVQDPLWLDSYLNTQSSKQPPLNTQSSKQPPLSFYGSPLQSSPQSSPSQSILKSPKLPSSLSPGAEWISRKNNKEVKNVSLSRKRRKKITAPVTTRKMKPPSLKQQTLLTKDRIQLIDDKAEGSDSDILARSNDRLRALRKMENYKQANRSKDPLAVGLDNRDIGPKGSTDVLCCVDFKHDDDLVMDEDDGSNIDFISLF